MKQLQIKLAKKQLDGAISSVLLNLGTLAPVTITGVSFSAPARLVVCEDLATRDRLVQQGYQMMQKHQPGILLHVASNIIHSDFNFAARPIYLDQHAVWLRYPHEWQPVTVQANNKDGLLFCMVEARAGNAKHKAEIIITLQVADD